MLVAILELGFEWLDVYDCLYKPLFLYSIDDQFQIINKVAVIGVFLAQPFERPLHHSSPLLYKYAPTSLVMNLTFV